MVNIRGRYGQMDKRELVSELHFSTHDNPSHDGVFQPCDGSRGDLDRFGKCALLYHVVDRTFLKSNDMHYFS